MIRRRSITMKSNITFSKIYELAWPAIISNATIMFVSAIDLMFVGRLPNPTISLAAASLANNACIAIYSFFEGIRSGTTILVAQFFGAQEDDKVSKTFNISLVYSILLGILIIVISPLLSILIYKIVGSYEIEKLGVKYLIIQLAGVPLTLITFSVVGLFRGLNNTTIPFIITAIICTLNVILNYELTTNMHIHTNINDIALATVISYVIGAVVSFIFAVKHKLTKRFINFNLGLNEIRKQYYKLCKEIGLYHGIVIIALFIFIFMFTRLGTIALTSNQIVLQVFSITYLVPMGFFVAATIIIGNIVGEEKYKEIIPAARKIWYASLAPISTICILILIFSKQISLLFSPYDLEVANQTAQSIYIVSFIQLLNSLYLTLKGSLIAVSDTRFILLFGTATSYLLFLPLSYILGIHLGYGVFGGYMAFLIWTLTDMAVLSWRFFIFKPWKHSR